MARVTIDHSGVGLGLPAVALARAAIFAVPDKPHGGPSSDIMAEMLNAANASSKLLTEQRNQWLQQHDGAMQRVEELDRWCTNAQAQAAHLNERHFENISKVKG